MYNPKTGDEYTQNLLCILSEHFFKWPEIQPLMNDFAISGSDFVNGQLLITSLYKLYEVTNCHFTA